MDNRASGIWMVIVFLSIVFLWVLELNGTIDRVLQSEKMAASQRKEDKLKYALEDQKQSMKFGARNQVGSKFDEGQLTDDADESKSLDDIIKMNEYYLSELEKSRGSSEPAPAPAASAAGHLKEGSEQSANQDMKQNDGMELEPLRVHISEDDLYERPRKLRRRKRQDVTPGTPATCNQAELKVCEGKITTDNKCPPTVPDPVTCETDEKSKCAEQHGCAPECHPGMLARYQQACKDALGEAKDCDDKFPDPAQATDNQACKNKLDADKLACGQKGCDSAVKKAQSGGGGEEREREKCNPIPPRGEAPSRKHETHLPPCRLFPPEEIEPIPAHLYGGTLSFGANTCWTMHKIAEIQAKGTENYPPETERPELPGITTKYKNVHAGVESKADEIDKRTCILSRGLECIEREEIDEHGVKVKSKSEEGTCGCMSAFGGKPEERLQINGTCYIRAEAGDMSICFGDIGLPLPSGDTYYKNEWNTVKLPCAPGSTCIESSLWTGKRCACKKGYELVEDGTCSFAVSTLSPTSIFQLMLVILAVVSAW